MSDEYSATLFVNEGAEGGQREVQQGDDLVLLVAHMLEDLARHAGQEEESSALTWRLEAVVLLEQALRYSPYNYHFRLALMAGYRRLGAWEAGIVHYNHLEVKQVQVDTLSWLLFPGCFKAGFYTEARVRCQNILGFHRNCQREAEDYGSKALSLGTYAKALEIDTFQRTRMSRSLQLGLAKVELARLELLQRHHSLEAALLYLRELAGGMVPESLDRDDDQELERLSDNLDYTVIKDWAYRDDSGLLRDREARRQRNVLR